MAQTPEFNREPATAGDTAQSREHSEIAAEGSDGTEMAEIRMHSQDAAEGPDETALS